MKRIIFHQKHKMKGKPLFSKNSIVFLDLLSKSNEFYLFFNILQS